MARKRVTEIFPFLLPLRRKQRKACFYIKMRLDKDVYAETLQEEKLPYEVFSMKSLMINEKSGYDIKYQYNKVHNLKLAAKKLNGLMIAPGETFSLCIAIKSADKMIPYRDGLNLVDGKITGSYGGGLCQMSNVLFWVFMHSPLTITERHGHDVESLVPAPDVTVTGVDATISEGWLDLKARNDTDASYQVTIDFDEENMNCSLRSDKPAEFEYEIYNSKVEYFKEYFEKKERVFCRAEVSCQKKNLADGRIENIKLYQNLCEIGYDMEEEKMREKIDTKPRMDKSIDKRAADEKIPDQRAADRKVIAVLFGGCSPEYAVSLQSAYAVLSNLDERKYTVIPLGITPDGCWVRYNGNYENIKNDTWYEDGANCVIACISPDRGTHGIVELHGNTITRVRIDMAFPVLHGKCGEDGMAQGLIEMAGIPLIGCDTLSSALCMDKDRAHKLAVLAGIGVPKAAVVKESDSIADIYKAAGELEYPVYVKPVRAGSSFGISKIERQEELERAVKLALKHDSRVIIEENIEGFEVGCSVLGNDSLTVGRVDEIELDDVLFDYKEKYTQDHTTIHMPARIDPDMERKIQEDAKTIYKALGCSGFARVDMFITPDERIFFNEVNTIPGLTVYSRYPKMLNGIGLSFAEIIDRLVELGEENEKYEEKRKYDSAG